MVTAEWPLGVLTYTLESTVSCGIWTVMRTSPLLVLLQVADTSGPWMGWRSCEVAAVPVYFSLGHATEYTISILFNFWFYKAGFML